MRILLAAALAAGMAAAARGQDQYEGLPLAPYEIFAALTAFAEEGAFERLGAAARKSEPLVAALDPGGARGLARAIEESVRMRDRDAARRAVLDLIHADLLVNLRRARVDADRREALLKMAFMDFHYLLAAVRARDPGRAAAVLRSFRRARAPGGLDELEGSLAGLERLWR